MPKLALSNENYKWIAEQLGWEPEMVIAFNKVECKREPFDKDGFPAILYERHVFYRNLPLSKAKEFARSYPDICAPTGYGKGGYGSYALQRVRFSKAFYLDKDAAMEACSWGAFQELGENWESYGFSNVGEFVDTMKNGLYGQCDIFIRSIKARGLVSAGQNRQFAKLARNYNGKNYAQFGYDAALEREYKNAKKAKIKWSAIKASPPKAKENPVWIGNFIEKDVLSRDLSQNDGIDEFEMEDNYVDRENRDSSASSNSGTNNGIDASSIEREEQSKDSQPSQHADQITNINQGTVVPSNFQPENISATAPQATHALSKAWKWILGLGIFPTSTAGAIEVLKNLTASGDANWADVFIATKTVFVLLLPYLFWIAMIFIAFWGLKEICKQVSFWITQYTNARPDMHNVVVIPREEEKPSPRGLIGRFL